MDCFAVQVAAVSKVLSGFKEAITFWKAAWKSAITISGGQCAQTISMLLMQEWPAGSWDFHPKVHGKFSP